MTELPEVCLRLILQAGAYISGWDRSITRLEPQLQLNQSCSAFHSLLFRYKKFQALCWLILKLDKSVL